MFSFLRAALAFLALAVPGALTVDYTYKNKDKWDVEFALHCAGERQSPIDIRRTETDWNLPKFFVPFKFENYGAVPNAQYAANNFHTLAVTADYDNKPTISGGGLPGRYEFLNLHFHWGADETKGSEHTLDTVQYPLELHIVHAKKGVNLENVLEYPDGLAVFGIFFEISEQDNPALERIFNAAARVISGESTAVEAPYALASLFPNDLRRYYRYEGSLTTPVCDEAVIWTVFKDPLHVSVPQLNKLRQLGEIDGTKIVDNFRDPQPLNGRTIYRSWL